ncbi:hypothetical protein JTB14_021451 [Gonioctena quinquepunctata]|nr:hypothetical protein JTB14_021451 [Gonioctena quinquepunctata]
MKVVKDFHLNDWPRKSEKLGENIKYYWKLKGDITLFDGSSVYRERVIVPEKLRNDIKSLVSRKRRYHFGQEWVKILKPMSQNVRFVRNLQDQIQRILYGAIVFPTTHFKKWQLT